MSMIERVAIAISGQDAAGWAALPENKRERLYSGKGWPMGTRDRDEWRDDAARGIEAMREPTEAMLLAADVEDELASEDGDGAVRAFWHWQAMIDAALGKEGV